MAEKDRVRTEQFRFTLLPEENAKTLLYHKEIGD